MNTRKVKAKLAYARWRLGEFVTDLCALYRELKKDFKK